MIYFFDEELESELINTLNQWYKDEIITKVTTKKLVMIPYKEEIKIPLLRKDSEVSFLSFECYDNEDNIIYDGRVIINIIGYENTNIFHVRFIYIENQGINPILFYRIYDIFKKDEDKYEFHISGEESQVSQMAFINDDKRIHSIYMNQKILQYLQNTTLELIRTYYTPKQRNKI